MNLYRKLRHAGTDWRGRLGLNERLFREARGARIVAYHGICRSDPGRFNSLFVDAATFERHLQFYAEYFQVLSLNDYYAGRFSDSRFNICLTFDDGFANNYNYAMPMMAKYGIPAVFFVTGISEAGYPILWNDWLSMMQKFGPSELALPGGPAFIRKGGRYRERGSGLGGRHQQAGGEGLRERLQAGDFREKELLIRSVGSPAWMHEHEEYWLQMTEKQLRLLAGHPLVTIGCHGYYHNDLGRISLSRAMEELKRNREYLNRITNAAINALAFPYGSYTMELILEAKRMGFDRLLALDLRFPADAAEVSLRPRMVINPFITLHNQMTAIIHGKY
jgi:peptidoglycan/xylan/chitin deacetylase (PgdA/CDA1 family)